MEAATTTTAAEAPAEVAEAGSEAPAAAERSSGNAEDHPAETGDERDESGRYLSREAASYRRFLRETETERDDLRRRLEGYEREHVERIASDAGLQVPSDVWQFGARLDALRGEDGAIDAEAVNGLVAWLRWPNQAASCDVHGPRTRFELAGVGYLVLAVGHDVRGFTGHTAPRSWP